MHGHADDLAGRAFGHDLQRAAADFTIGGEPLVRQTRVNDHFEGLAAKRALDVGELFHAGI